MALSAYQGPVLFTDRFPSFGVVNGLVLHDLNGVRRKLAIGDSVSYRRHGTVKVLLAKDNHGRIEVTLPSGDTHRAVIPVCEWLTLKEGTRHLKCRIPPLDLGHVCPSWATKHVNPREWTIEPCTDGTYAIIDHSLNGVTVYVGKTATECRDWYSRY